LKEKYASRLPIFLDLEVEMYSGVDLTGYDYLIGSIHYLKKGDEYIGFDRSADEVKRVIDTYFGGSGLEFAKEYYKEVPSMLIGKMTAAFLALGLAFIMYPRLYKNA